MERLFSILVGEYRFLVFAGPVRKVDELFEEGDQGQAPLVEGVAGRRPSQSTKSTCLCGTSPAVSKKELSEAG
jgi:hypothetical protein